jgi:small Trp-rich protein
LTIVGIVFVVLKLVGVEPVADWSWWLVTAPFWAPLMLSLAFMGVMLLLSTRYR